MKTINFCGDSFCARDASDEDKLKYSWTSLLANKLNYKIIGGGKSGAAYEHAIKSFNDKADITIFCWTDADRIHNEKYAIFLGVKRVAAKEYNYPYTGNNEDLNSIYKAADYYYNYLHDSSLSKLRYMRELYWFDQVILSKYKGTIVHISCFHTIYQFTNGINIPGLLYWFPWSRKGNNKEQIVNHLTIQENIKLANKIYKVLEK